MAVLEMPFVKTEFDNVDDWLRDGVTCIGASESPGIVGAGYADESSIVVWDRKVNPCFEQVDRELFEWGHAIQPITLAMFQKKSGIKVCDLGSYTRARHPEFPWFACTLDGYTIDPNEGMGVIEGKNVGEYSRSEWEADEPPLRVQVQIQHQMGVTGATHGYAVACVGGNKLRWRKVERNDRFIDALLKRLDEFWGYVQARELPPIDDKIATGQVLAKLWPKDNSRTVPLADEALQWAIDRELAKAVIKECEGVCTLAENHIKAAIGEATFGDLPNLADGALIDASKERLRKIVDVAAPEMKPRYSWKEQSRKSYVVEATSYRVLRMTK